MDDAKSKLQKKRSADIKKKLTGKLEQNVWRNGKSSVDKNC